MKNMDPLNENIVQQLRQSQDQFVCTIWKDGECHSGRAGERARHLDVELRGIPRGLQDTISLDHRVEPRPNIMI